MSEVISIASRRGRPAPAAIDAEPLAAFEVLSAIPGRVRLRVPPLHRSQLLKQAIERELRAQGGITAVSANTLTATVLIVHAPTQDLALIRLTLAGLIRRAAPGAPAAGAAPRASAPPAQDLDVRRVRKLLAHAEPQLARPWHRLSAEEVLAAVDSRRQGLRTEEAAQRLKRYGANILPEAEPRSALSMFFGQFKSLPVALLGASAVISLATGGSPMRW